MSTASGPDTHTRILLVPHPKIVFLYPTFVMAILAGLYTHFTKNKDGTGEHVISLIFLFILGFNLIVIAFDFPRTTSLTMFFAVIGDLRSRSGSSSRSFPIGGPGFTTSSRG